MSILSDLQEFAAAPVAKEITHNGKTKTFYFKELSADEAENLFDIATEDGKTDKKKTKGLDNRILAATLCNAAGATEVTPDEIGKLPAAFRRKLATEAMEVNGLGAKKDTSTTTPVTGTE